MPSYSRTFRRSYKYRTRRNRYRKTFSKYNTYRNRSSVSQANQIYKLNKRISRIESNTKPEYLEYNPTPVGNLIESILTLNKWSNLNPLHITDLSSSGQFGDLMKGQSARAFKIIVWGALERNPAVLPENVDKHDSSMSCGYVRMAVLQYQAEKYADVEPDSIFDTEHGPAGFYQPLKKGCSSYGRILKIFNIKISSQDPVTKNFKFVIKPKFKVVHKSLTEEAAPVPNQRMKNGIVILPIGHVESNNITHPDTFHLSLAAKVVYTDA